MWRSKMNKFWCALALFTTTLGAQAQSKLAVSAPDSIPFSLSVDGQLLNIVEVNSLQMAFLNPGKHTVVAKAKTGEATYSLTAKNLILHSLRFTYNTAGVLELVNTGDTKLTASQFKLAAPAVVTVTAAVPASEDDLASAKCPAPFSSDSLQVVLTQIKNLHFDSQKRDLVNQVLNLGCFWVKDIVTLTTLVEMEENRLDCLSNAVAHIYDQKNANQLLTLLFLPRNQELLSNKLKSETGQ